MLLTLTTTHAPATDLGFLLHKNPSRPQTFDLAFGRAHVLYPESDAERCTACVMEAIEHLDPLRLAAFKRVLVKFARPMTVTMTTPNVEYDVHFKSLPAGQRRHRDHRFEWTRAQFQSWANAVATRFSYSMRFLPVGPDDADVARRRRWRCSVPNDLPTEGRQSCN